jgi:acid phosphatase type 7
VTPKRSWLPPIVLLLGGVAVVVLAIVVYGIQQGYVRRPLPGPDVSPLPLPLMAPVPDGAVRVLAAGDIGRCGSRGAAATGALLDAAPGAVVLALGDLAYQNGSATDFSECYDPVWGGARARTIPVPGNHEYRTAGASGYLDYFGDAAGSPEATWTARTVGAWRIYALDTECDEVGGCGEGSAQLAWLREDLAANPSQCTLAIWHRPHSSSGPHGDDPAGLPFWHELAAAGADIVLSGHDHIYERFAPMDAEGVPAPGGIRSWVVGTGGDELYGFGAPRPGSEVRWNRAHGVLELILRPEGYDWRFLAAIGEPFEDSGSGTC